MFLLRVARPGKYIFVVLALVSALFVTTPDRAMAATAGYIGSAVKPSSDGYWLVTSQGIVTASGNARFFGDVSRVHLNSPVIAIASTATGNGYWILAQDGGVFTFGDAAFHGSTGALRLNQPVVGMAATPSGRGYWLVASDGGIFSFGDARFFGSTGAIRLNKPVVGMSSTSDGNGYWLVASDGGIFSFGSAGFQGSTGAITLNQPIVAMSTTLSGSGYWLVASDGGVFSFGDAPFRGSTVGMNRSRTIGILRDSSGGYTIASEGGILDLRPGTGGAAVISVPVVPPVPTPPIPVAPAPVSQTPAGWSLKAFEDFNGTALNERRWATYDGVGSGGIGRVSPSALSVGGGVLNITSQNYVTGGTCWCNDGDSSQTYGKWEVRAKMDNGKGYWPAILLWPDSERWPIDGEIDIAEFNEPLRTESSFTVHYGADNKQIQYTSKGDFTQWHTFGVDWQPTYLKYYLDGVLMYTITKPEAIPHTSMHLALQTAAGDGSWVSQPDGSRTNLQIDWVKVYHR